MPSSSQVKGTELPPQHPSSCCSLIFGPMAFMVLLDFIQTHVVSDSNTGVEDFSAEINWIKHFVCFDDSGRQRGKSSTCMWSLNRTLISVPNTVLFFSCFCIYLFFGFFYCFRKEKLTWDLQVNLALLSALEKIYFVVCGNLYRSFCLSLFFFSCLVNYFILQTFFSLHGLFMSAVHCMKRFFFFFLLWLYNIPFGEKRSLLHYLRKWSQTVQYVAFISDSQPCTVGRLILI